MSMPSEPEGTPDKIIDRFKEVAEDAVDDARKGATDDNPVKETIRDSVSSDGKNSDDQSKEQ